MIVPNRRSFLAGLVSACAAPAIVTSSGFRSGLWLPEVTERWLAFYDMGLDAWTVRADFAKGFPDSSNIGRSFGSLDNVPDEVRRLINRGSFGVAAAEAKRRAAIAQGPAFYGVDIRLTGDALRFRPRSPHWMDVAVGNVDRLLQVAPSIRRGIGAAGAE